MTEFQTTTTDPIDAVITWVDGSTASHRSTRARYMAQAQAPLHENAVNPHRWHCSDEILYCLQSIANHAPWTRKIWIVVDRDTPDLSTLPETLRAKIRFVYHSDIFRPFHHVLPTFNSLAIESLIWRIEGLSERFMYFNDDVFLTAPLLPQDVFHGDAPVLRGTWADHSHLARNAALRSDPSKFNLFMQINAAQLAGFDAVRMFGSAHVVHPLRRDVMERLFDRHFGAFMDNISHRFRDISQFLPQGLHNHTCIAERSAVIQQTGDHLHLTSGHGIGRSPAETRSLLEATTRSEIKFLCINDLPQLELVIPEARAWLRRAVGGASCETLER